MFLTTLEKFVPKEGEHEDIEKTLCSYEYEFITMEGIKITKNKGSQYVIFIPIDKERLTEIQKGREEAINFFERIDHYKVWQEKKLGYFYTSNFARTIMILCLNMYRMLKINKKDKKSNIIKRTIKMEM